MLIFLLFLGFPVELFLEESDALGQLLYRRQLILDFLDLHIIV